MIRLNSKKVIQKIREFKTRIKEFKVGPDDLTPFQQEIIDLCEIVFSKKAYYKSIDSYMPPSNNRVELPPRRPKPGFESEPAGWLSSDDALTERNRKFLKDALNVLTRAESKYSIRSQLEK